MADFSDKQLRDWLLHSLDGTCGEAIERALFTDAGLADRVDEARHDLFDDYAHGRLTLDERERVQRFLAVTSADAQRLRIAAALARSAPATDSVYMQQPSPATVRRIGLGLAVAACLLIGFVTWRWQFSVPARESSATAEQMAASMPIVTLAIAQQRSGGARTIVLPIHTGDIRLQAEIADTSTQAKRYLLTIGDAQNPSFVVDNLVPRTLGPYRFVETIVPVRALRPGRQSIQVVEEGGKGAAESWDVEIGKPVQ
jgi:hypothetical protein